MTAKKSFTVTTTELNLVDNVSKKSEAVNKKLDATLLKVKDLKSLGVDLTVK